MRKITAILAAALTLTCISANTVAAETKNTEISMTVDPSMESYTLTIPATVQIDPAEKNGEIDVVLSDVNLCWNTFLTVYATSENHIDGEDGSYLVNTTNDSTKISYSVFSECTGDTSFEATSQGIYAAIYNAAHEWRGTSYPENLKDGTMSLTIDGSIPGSGTYTDTLTFSVDLQTMADVYDRQDRDISLAEARNFAEFLYTEFDQAFSENGTYKVVTDISEVNSGEKYVLEDDLERYRDLIEGYYINVGDIDNYAKIHDGDIQKSLNFLFYTTESEWKTFWETKIHRKA